ncbi:MAG TPA: Hsp20/alpha crystallin family protein, partial [Methanomicrobiales archaeon]|nr:Hsp20/alpha crystallin family protein [Methanomicrobiales archaeon]
FSGQRAEGGAEEGRLTSMLRGADVNVDVREHGDEVVVVADLPGVDKDNISLRLLDPRTLQVSTRRETTAEEEREGYYMRERRFGSMSRTVFLPADVTTEDASSSFKNGVLEVHLQKSPEERGRTIPVGGESLPERGGTTTYGKPTGEEQYRREQEQYKKEQQEAEPSGMKMTSRELMDEAKGISTNLEKGLTPEQKRVAEERRRHTEGEYREDREKIE